MKPNLEVNSIDFDSFWLHGVNSADEVSQLTATEITKRAHILVVDDSSFMRAALVHELAGLGYTHISQVHDGKSALDLLNNNVVDLVLLDIEMPGISGMDVLATMKSSAKLSTVPIIVISGILDEDKVMKCIELGAEDFLSKPFNPTLLKARVSSSIEKKLLRDLELKHVEEMRKEQEQLALEKDKSDRLLLNILPALIAHELKTNTSEISQAHDEVTVLFSDLVGFTSFSRSVSASELVHMLNRVFSAFDDLAFHLKLEKIKTIGDAYMLVGGLPIARPDHAQACIQMGLGMITALEVVNKSLGCSLQMRIGMHSGPVAAGVIGKRKFAYDIWGDTVNTASRMESTGQAGCIQVSQSTYEFARGCFHFEPTGGVDCKGIGLMPSYLVS
ncbi:MAG: adenylate/guanylate cyclase domain-containing protein [Burkholderiales bacterium]